MYSQFANRDSRMHAIKCLTAKKTIGFRLNFYLSGEAKQMTCGGMECIEEGLRIKAQCKNSSNK